MVYVYANKSKLDKYIKENLSVDEIKKTLNDLGMDVKGISQDDDPELKIEITAEKMDLISPIGIARAINYYQEFSKSLPNYNVEVSDYKIIVDDSVEKVRPKTVAAVIKNLDINQEVLDEIIELQEKIHSSFGRDRKKAAIGIYPLEEIKFPITYKAEKPENIVFRPLEAENEMNANEILDRHETGKKYAHLLKESRVYPIFEDSKGEILSMPPIINSHSTGRITTNHKDFFIECSGHNIIHLDSILKTIITTLLEYGGEAYSVKVDYKKEDYTLNLENKKQTISLDEINSLIGINIGVEDVKKLLNKMQLEIKNEKEKYLEVLIPPYRQDIYNDCDIADNVARAYGYNNIENTTPKVVSIGETLKHSDYKNNIAETMTNLGFIELYTYMLTSSKTQFDLMNRDEKKHIPIVDSAEEGINMTRTMILPENLESLRVNRKHKYPQRVFECGFIIEEDKTSETGAKDSLVLSASIADPKANLTQIKEILDTLSTLFSWNLEITDTTHNSFIEGRCGSIWCKGIEIGVFGELNPQVLENFDLLVPVCSLEINLEKLIKS